MPLDRRGFLSLVAGGLAGLPLRARSAPEPGALAARIHRETRNTWAGAIGRSLWPSQGPRGIAKAYQGRPRLGLPEAADPGQGRLHDAVRFAVPPPGFAPGPLSRERLAGLLHLTNGVTKPGRPPLRAAPSAGALYAGEVYVAVARVEGLAPGVYSYHVPSHALVPLATGDVGTRLAQAFERPAEVAGAPATVLLTNVFERYTGRYANRGYRYALIDSGHIGENLRLAAGAAGLATHAPRRFQDARLNDLLGIDGRREAVCAVHAVGRPGPPVDASEPTASVPLVEAHRTTGLSADEEGSTPERYHAATALVPDPSAPGRRGGAEPHPEVPDRGDSGTALPVRRPATASVSWAIRERRSAARFRPEPVALEEVSYLLDLVRRGASTGPEVGIRVAAHRVVDLPPGLYAYDRDAHGLDLLRRGDLRSSLRRACGGQEKAETAAAAFAMVADLGIARSRGDRVYRDLLLESGAMAQRLYLGAEALGLAARNLAAFFDDALNELLSLEGRRVVLHFTVVGAGD